MNHFDRHSLVAILLTVCFCSGCGSKSDSTSGPSETSEHWIQSWIDTGTVQISEIAVGDLDEDGVAEVYACDYDYFVYQIKWESGWVWETIGSGAGWIDDLTVGDGNGDGNDEVYFAPRDDYLYQIKWTGSEWEQTVVDSVEGNYVLTAGDGDREGTSEIYACNRSHDLFQYKWTGVGWVKMHVITLEYVVSTMEIGDGDGDGLTELYACYDSWIHQVTWTGTEWEIADVGRAGNTAIGDADGDGASELYACASRAYVDDDVYTTDYYIGKYIWTGSQWGIEEFLGTITQQAPSYPPFPSYNDASVGDANGDGSLEIYSVNENGFAYQFKWNGLNWVQKEVSTELETLREIDMGDADGDGLEEVFCLAAGGRRIYQLEVD